jgi:hypothetical protein
VYSLVCACGGQGTTFYGAIGWGIGSIEATIIFHNLSQWKSSQDSRTKMHCRLQLKSVVFLHDPLQAHFLELEAVEKRDRPTHTMSDS